MRRGISVVDGPPLNGEPLPRIGRIHPAPDVVKVDANFHYPLPGNPPAVPEGGARLWGVPRLLVENPPAGGVQNSLLRRMAPIYGQICSPHLLVDLLRDASELPTKCACRQNPSDEKQNYDKACLDHDALLESTSPRIRQPAGL